jgi:crotonobetainyl-CoA:carnitine CoA-transferase CaiB-like acyl-CoA transferase
MASGVLAGLVKRSTTGKGCVVGTSQTQALLWMQMQAIGIVANTGQKADRFDPLTTSNPLFTVYQTADGWIAIAALREPQWPAIANRIGLEHLLEEERFSGFIKVMKNRDEFRPIFAEHLKSQTTSHWFDALRGCGAWVSPVNRLEDLATDENIIANEYLVTFDDGFVGPPTVFDIDGFKGVRGPTADYSEHTDSVLADLGYDDEAILNLRAEGAIW